MTPTDQPRPRLWPAPWPAPRHAPRPGGRRLARRRPGNGGAPVSRAAGPQRSGRRCLDPAGPLRPGLAPAETSAGVVRPGAGGRSGAPGSAGRSGRHSGRHGRLRRGRNRLSPRRHGAPAGHRRLAPVGRCCAAGRAPRPRSPCRAPRGDAASRSAGGLDQPGHSSGRRRGYAGRRTGAVPGLPTGTRRHRCARPPAPRHRPAPRRGGSRRRGRRRRRQGTGLGLGPGARAAIAFQGFGGGFWWSLWREPCALVRVGPAHTLFSGGAGLTVKWATRIRRAPNSDDKGVTVYPSSRDPSPPLAAQDDEFQF